MREQAELRARMSNFVADMQKPDALHEFVDDSSTLLVDLAPAPTAASRIS